MRLVEALNETATATDTATVAVAATATVTLVAATAGSQHEANARRSCGGRRARVAVHPADKLSPHIPRPRRHSQPTIPHAELDRLGIPHRDRLPPQPR